MLLFIPCIILYTLPFVICYCVYPLLATILIFLFYSIKSFISILYKLTNAMETVSRIRVILCLIIFVYTIECVCPSFHTFFLTSCMYYVPLAKPLFTLTFFLTIYDILSHQFFSV